MKTSTYCIGLCFSLFLAIFSTSLLAKSHQPAAATLLQEFENAQKALANQDDPGEVRNNFQKQLRDISESDPIAGFWFEQWGLHHTRDFSNPKDFLNRLKNAWRDVGHVEGTPEQEILQTPLANPELSAALSRMIETADAHRHWQAFLTRIELFNTEALRRRAEILSQKSPDLKPRFNALLAELPNRSLDFETLLKEVSEASKQPLRNLDRLEQLQPRQEALRAFREQFMRAQPASDIQQILYIRQGNLGGTLKQNWISNAGIRGRFDNELAIYDAGTGQSRQFYKPESQQHLADLDLHFNADRLLFTQNAAVHEIHMDGTGLRQVITEIDSADACYLPDGRVLFVSQAVNQGVPCIGGRSGVGNLHLANPDGSGIRRLCFDQDHNWSPTVLPDGRVMFTRWEYTDSAHYFSRLIMTMNPDGTNQRALYGSNSYWPNSIFYAKPVPGSQRFIGIVSGHHGVARQGELVLFDPDISSFEADGAVQKIPGWGQEVEPVIKDRLVDGVWPLFLHPEPLSEDTFLVVCQPGPENRCSIYMADLYDNLVPIIREDGVDLLEPVPLRPRPLPVQRPDMVDLTQKDATIFMADVYHGGGLRGVPRGTVKSLLVQQYIYGYQGTGGHYEIGFEGPWDVRVIHGRVPVHDDGSALFKAPANVPLSVQPLDAEGKAVAGMRSWMTAMPGEILSCVGCHETPQETPSSNLTNLMAREPVEIEPWFGEPRGFSFRREVQPVLDRHCIGCHDGTNGRPDLRDQGLVGGKGPYNRYSRAYLDLHPFVRRNGPEGDYHLLTPLEFHANTSELVRLLEKGHHGVELDPESWDRLITWIDLNVPFHGTWPEADSGANRKNIEKRLEHNAKYSNRTTDYCQVPEPQVIHAEYQPPAREPVRHETPRLQGWPFTAETARQMQGEFEPLVIPLGEEENLQITLNRIPAGKFVMGDADGFPDEKPHIQEITHPFWMATCEISQAQFQQFDPTHRNGVYDMHYKDQVDRGYELEEPDLPAVRISWEQARDFCRWLSERTGLTVQLPTEAQWEWACRAGSAEPLSWGALDTDFGKHGNLADVSIKLLAVRGVNPKPIKNPDEIMDFVPAIRGVDDGTLHLAAVGSYQPNPWGLHDMHGNAAEWTRNAYTPYPHSNENGNSNDKQDPQTDLETRHIDRVARGGSWRSRPQWARASLRLEYPQWQKVYDTGFRIIITDPTTD